MLNNDPAWRRVMRADLPGLRATTAAWRRLAAFATMEKKKHPPEYQISA